MKDPMENAPTGATGKERSRHDPEAGALIITRPQTPGRCQFTLLVPHEVTWTVEDFGAAYELRFRPRTPEEMAALWKEMGRKPLPEHLPRVEFELIPLEVQRAGLDAFVRIGDRSRPA